MKGWLSRTIFPGSVVGIMLRRRVRRASLFVREHPVKSTNGMRRIEYKITRFGRSARSRVTRIAYPHLDCKGPESSSSVSQVGQLNQSYAWPLTQAPPVASRPYPARGCRHALCVSRTLAVGSPRESGHSGLEFLQSGPVPALRVGCYLWRSSIS